QRHFCLRVRALRMITGRRAFEGKSQLSVASAILEKDPERVTAIQPAAPSALDHVVGDCLAKDPESRWQNAADISRELRWIATSEPGSLASPSDTRSHFVERLVWAAAVVVLLAVLLWLGLRGREPAITLRSYLPPPAGVGFDFT